MATAIGMSGCAATPPAPPTPPTSSSRADTAPASDAEVEAPPRYVLLQESATLASGLDGTADIARALDPSEAGSLRPLMWLVRHIDTHGPWLEVETVETDIDGPHCATPSRRLDGYRLRLFVRVEDVAPVVRRETTLELPNGNRVTIGPGMPVTLPGRDGGPTRVHTRPQMALPLPADAIGRDYAEPRHYDTGASVATLTLRPLRLTEDLRLPEHLAGMVYDRRDDGDAVVVTLADECMRYELRVPDSAIDPPQAYGVGGLGYRPPEPRYRITADAPIYWTNGERAGSTRHPIERHDEPSRREVGRVCFTHRITTGNRQHSSDPEFTLCFDAIDVTAVE